MRNISNTIARLAALKAMRPAGPIPGGAPSGRLTGLTGFGSNPGALKAGYYLPRHFEAGRPLVVVLHGCTQTAAGYDHHSGWSQLADESRFALLYPEQQRGNNPNLCFNWFVPGDTLRQSGEALSIRQMIEAFAVSHRIDRERIFIVGLSAGGAMACAMLATYPEMFAGGAIVAGLAHGVAKTIPEAFDRMRGHGLPDEAALQRELSSASHHRGPWPRITIWHGSADQTVALSNAESIAAQWRGVHAVDDAPTYSKATGALTKKVWCDAAGDAVMEINTIAGMGHGTPLAAGLGSPGPFMLDVGISSTREIAKFWDVTSSDAALSSGRSTGPERQRQTLHAVVDADGDGAPPSDPVRPPERTQAVTGIQKTIEDALRAAGLMR